jgi:hypothetical protein
MELESTKVPTTVSAMWTRSYIISIEEMLVMAFSEMRGLVT